MKIGDIVIYKGGRYPERCGDMAEIINIHYRDAGHFILMFSDGKIHDKCYKGFLEPTKFVSLYNHKKIERPDIDPYGEDNWGYETENKKYKRVFEFKEYIKDIDPYDEDDWYEENLLNYYDSVKTYIDINASYNEKYETINFRYDDIKYIIYKDLNNIAKIHFYEDRFNIDIFNVREKTLKSSDWLDIRTAMNELNEN